MDSSVAVRRYELPVRGGSTESLFRRGWLPETPRAAVILVHGFGEHSGRYEHVGRWLAERVRAEVAKLAGPSASRQQDDQAIKDARVRSSGSKVERLPAATEIDADGAGDARGSKL